MADAKSVNILGGVKLSTEGYFKVKFIDPSNPNYDLPEIDKNAIGVAVVPKFKDKPYALYYVCSAQLSYYGFYDGYDYNDITEDNYDDIGSEKFYCSSYSYGVDTASTSGEVCGTKTYTEYVDGTRISFDENGAIQLEITKGGLISIDNISISVDNVLVYDYMGVQRMYILKKSIKDLLGTWIIITLDISEFIE